MNPEDDFVLKALAERVAAATLAPLEALRGAYGLGVAREIMDHAKQDPAPDDSK